MIPLRLSLCCNFQKLSYPFPLGLLQKPLSQRKMDGMPCSNPQIIDDSFQVNEQGFHFTRTVLFITIKSLKFPNHFFHLPLDNLHKNGIYLRIAHYFRR